MEEVDSIILVSLREIGCDFDDDVKLKNLTPEEVYKAIFTLCKIIKQEIDVPEKSTLPAQMAQRFGAASSLVDCVKALGFKGDLGYQTILYANNSELRGVLMWLIEHLPKNEDKVDLYQSGVKISKSKAIESEIAKRLGLDLKKPWIIDFLQKPSSIKATPIELEIPKLPGDELFLPPIFHQTRNLIPSILLTNSKQLTRNAQQDSTEYAKKLRTSTIKSTQSLNVVQSSSRSTLSSQSIAQEEGEEEKVIQEKIIPKSKIEILSEKVESLKESVNVQEEIFHQLSCDKKELVIGIESETKKIEQSKKSNKLKMQVAMLLDDSEVSIEKLKKSLIVATDKRQALNAKFEAHKEPLEQHLESFSNINSVKLGKIQERRENVKNIKRAIAEIHEDMKVKVSMQQNLQTELSKMKTNTKERSAYTSRIADIIKSIKKQNYDINEILKDTRMLQKSINNVEGQLHRQFSVSEELVWTKVSFKLIFNNLIELI